MSIKTKKYSNFSKKIHISSKENPRVAQIELTHRCPLHCRHCYCECYNTSHAPMLSTKKIKLILNKLKKDGIIWLCFTGGDPLTRKDFAEIYTYAKKLGFIITIFSSLIPINEKLLILFKKLPPFNIETTLPAAQIKKYKEITKTNHFKQHLKNIEKVNKAGLPLTLKITISKRNISQIEKIKKFAASLNLKLKYSSLIHACLNHNLNPCKERLPLKKEIALTSLLFEKNKKPFALKKNKKLFTCNIINKYLWITPQGKMTACSNLRNFTYDLTKKNNTPKKGIAALKKYILNLETTINSICKTCKFRRLCNWCPGRAFLEKKDISKPVSYFCLLAKEKFKIYNLNQAKV